MKEKCPKCGSELISTQYVTSEDRLKKTCERCGYWWHEEGEDTKDKDVQIPKQSS